MRPHSYNWTPSLCKYWYLLSTSEIICSWLKKYICIFNSTSCQQIPLNATHWNFNVIIVEPKQIISPSVILISVYLCVEGWLKIQSLLLDSYMRIVNTINLLRSPFSTSVGYNQNSLQILTKIECLKEKLKKKPLKCVCGFIKVKGFLGSIVHRQICHPFHWANVSCASGGTETSHSASALSPSSFTLPSHSSLPWRSLLSPDQVLTSDISPPP